MSSVPFWPQTLVDYAQIISAAATAAAVIVSLWLATRRPSPSLNVSVTIRLLIGPGVENPMSSRYLTFAVVNVGTSDVQLVSVGWRIRRRFVPDLHAIQDVSYRLPTVSNSPLPIKLGHGEEARYMIPLQGQFSWSEYLVANGFFPETIRSRDDLDRLYAVAHTSVGASIEAKVAPSVLNLVWELQQQYFAGRQVTSRAA